MPEKNIRPPSVSALPDSDPLNARIQALRDAVEAFGVVGQIENEVGRFASPVGAYESLDPIQSLALARMQQLLWAGNRQSLPATTVTWQRDPLSADPLASTTPRALVGLRKTLFADALGGKPGSPSARDKVKSALVALTAQLAPSNQTAIVQCQATLALENGIGRLSSWALVSASDSRYVVLYIASFGENSVPAPGNA